MKSKAIIALASIVSLACVGLSAGKLDGAYRLVAIKAPNGSQTEEQVKGMIVVHGNHMAFVRAGVNRPTWNQQEPADERNKKIIAAYQGLAATCGSFDLQGDTINLTQHAQANPGSMGATSKWRYKLEGNTLTIRPDANVEVEFIFERLPDKK